MFVKRNRKGFTIIEVVLVLAIAGLIFLMVFVALPALQRSQRDTARRNDVAVIAAAVRQYMRNNRGNPPPSSGSVSVGDYFKDDSAELRRYLTDLDPNGVTTVVSVADYYRSNRDTTSVRLTIGESDLKGQVSVYVGALCPESKDGDRSTNGKVLSLEITQRRTDVAIFRHLESGWWYCENM